QEVKHKVDHLDVLYNNAGGQFGIEREVTKEGHEKTFAINMLAPFLLTKLLLPLLEKSDSARIVTQSSESYQQGGEPLLDDVELENHYDFGKAYGLSKLYVWWLMREFDKQLKEKGVNNITVNSVEPGTALDTGLQRVSDRKSTRLNSSHVSISYAVFCLSKKNKVDGTAQARPALPRLHHLV